MFTDHLLGTSSSNRFNPSYPCCNRRFRKNLEETDLSCCCNVCTTAQLLGIGIVKSDHTDMVAILLSEKSSNPRINRFLERNITFFLQRNILADLCIHNVLNLFDLLISQLREVREVKTQHIWRNQ